MRKSKEKIRNTLTPVEEQPSKLRKTIHHSVSDGDFITFGGMDANEKTTNNVKTNTQLVSPFRST